MTASPNNTIVTAPGAIITDAYGNQWSLADGKVVVNGVVDQTTAHVLVLAYENGQIWQMNADRLWWEKTTPHDRWWPEYGTPVSPLVGVASPNNTVLVGSITAGWQQLQITDANDDHWSITPYGQVAVNGVVDQTTWHVTALVYENGVIWQQNQDGLWWSKSNAAASWEPEYGTAQSPIPGGAAIPQVTYFGGTTVDYTNSTSPAGYVAYTIADSPITFNYSGKNTIDGQIYSTNSELRINISGTLTNNGYIDTQQDGVSAVVTDITVNAGSEYINNGNMAVVNGNHGATLVIGGAGSMYNNDQVYAGSAAHVDVQTSVSGSGIWLESMGQASSLEFDNFVGSGETVVIGGYHSSNLLQIDHPIEFAASVARMDGTDQILLMGADVTAGSWTPDSQTSGFLQLFDHDTLVGGFHVSTEGISVFSASAFTVEHVAGNTILMDQWQPGFQLLAWHPVIG